MNNAPKQIWAYYTGISRDHEGGWAEHGNLKGSQPYTRTDVCAAAIARAEKAEAERDALRADLEKLANDANWSDAFCEGVNFAAWHGVKFAARRSEGEPDLIAQEALKGTPND